MKKAFPREVPMASADVIALRTPAARCLAPRYLQTHSPNRREHPAGNRRSRCAHGAAVRADAIHRREVSLHVEIPERPAVCRRERAEHPVPLARQDDPRNERERRGLTKGAARVDSGDTGGLFAGGDRRIQAALIQRWCPGDDGESVLVDAPFPEQPAVSGVDSVDRCRTPAPRRPTRLA
jgi:hypothetical protein